MSETEVNPMDLSKEEYQEQVSKLVNEEPIVEVTEEPVIPELDEPDITDESDQDDISESTEPEEDLFEIVYKGEVKKLPKDKMIELAQKGFSYHSDMNRIAPHKKLVTLIEEDEEISTLVNDYLLKRAKPTTSKLEDFDTEEAWLEDNLERRQKAEKFKKSVSTPT